MMYSGGAGDRARRVFSHIEPLLQSISYVIHRAPLAESERLEVALMFAVAAHFPVAHLTGKDPGEHWGDIAARIADAARQMMPPELRAAMEGVYAVARRIKREAGSSGAFGAEVAPLLFNAGVSEDEAAEVAAAIWLEVQEEGEA